VEDEETTRSFGRREDEKIKTAKEGPATGGREVSVTPRREEGVRNSKLIDKPGRKRQNWGEKNSGKHTTETSDGERRNREYFELGKHKRVKCVSRIRETERETTLVWWDEPGRKRSE